ncbi:right-handed parallel beta-helix repeat-containing protein [Phenylobacterium sp.]|uniref:right-handed parallel beta-helix repeat-containing protein n=1 Tax=Phenylobacterium sp. TaxID=1871053 RepID=UPI0025D222A0|nr:right-handed parallel beta-helix repeat-containing protein [Phenylobacterium sp.]MBX3482554.1 right-handed parallel beta-helix repeat-containing protein [Phenylobacterium sp.]MCW5758762.1 right-handed parallel beta-helix repeat-containing protein [Phenylobacterium sp.]
MIRTFCAALMGLIALACAPAWGATLTATPATFVKVLSAAKPGDRIVLAAGAYGLQRPRKLDFTPAVTVDATLASDFAFYGTDLAGLTFAGGSWASFRIDRGCRIVVEGGTFVSAEPGEGTGILINGGCDVAIRGNRLAGYKNGISAASINGYVIEGNGLSWMRSDGLRAGLSRNGRIVGNMVQGTMTVGDEHPDCIQLWSRPGQIARDVLIEGNTCVNEDSQGIGLFNHVRDGVDDGGYDNITIRNNLLIVGRPNGLTVTGGRNTVLENNVVRTWPGAKWQAKITITGGSVARCGNSVGVGAGRKASADPAC